MAETFTASCDPSATRAALAAVGPACSTFTNAVSEDSASHVAGEARRRVARGPTGRTAGSIAVYRGRKDPDSWYVVARFAALYLEYGTKRMAAEQFLTPSVRLESPGFQRRQHDAVQAGIDSTGLGPHAG